MDHLIVHGILWNILHKALFTQTAFLSLTMKSRITEVGKADDQSLNVAFSISETSIWILPSVICDISIVLKKLWKKREEENSLSGRKKKKPQPKPKLELKCR